MPTIRLCKNNTEIIVPAALADKELYEMAVKASPLPAEKKDALLKEAGILDMFGMGGLLPEEDFKKLWVKEQLPGGQFTKRIISLKDAAEKGRLDGGLLIQGLEALAAAGSAKAAALLPKYKMVIDSWMRGNKAAEAEAKDIIAKLTPEFQKLVRTKPAHFTGTKMDRSRSQYV